MPGRVIFTVGNLALDIDPVHHEILGEHIFDIAVDLAYSIYIPVVVHTNFANIPFTKEADSSVP